MSYQEFFSEVKKSLENDFKNDTILSLDDLYIMNEVQKKEKYSHNN